MRYLLQEPLNVIDGEVFRRNIANRSEIIEDSVIVGAVVLSA